MSRNAFWDYFFMELLYLIIIFGALFALFFRVIAASQYFHLRYFSHDTSFYSLFLAALAIPLWMVGRYWYISTLQLKFTDRALDISYSIYGLKKHRVIAYSDIRKILVGESLFSSFTNNRYAGVRFFDDRKKKEHQIVLGFFPHPASLEIEKKLTSVTS